MIFNSIMLKTYFMSLLTIMMMVVVGFICLLFCYIEELEA